MYYLRLFYTESFPTAAAIQSEKMRKKEPGKAFVFFILNQFSIWIFLILVFPSPLEIRSPIDSSDITPKRTQLKVENLLNTSFIQWFTVFGANKVFCLWKVTITILKLKWIENLCLCIECHSPEPIASWQPFFLVTVYLPLHSFYSFLMCPSVKGYIWKIFCHRSVFLPVHLSNNRKTPKGKIT